MRPSLRATLPLVAAALSAVAEAQDVQLEARPTRWRMGVDWVPRDEADDLVLVGAHYDFLSPLEVLPPLYAGLGGYVAVDGTENGFFLGGATLGALIPAGPRWTFDAGVFVGAGGDAGGPARDGWAVRPFVAVERGFRLSSVRAEVGWLDMDGAEGDWTFGIGLDLSSELLLARRRRSKRELPPEALVTPTTRVGPRFLWIDPESGSRTTRGEPLDHPLVLTGLGVDYHLDPTTYLVVEGYGATGGGVGGFALAGAGLGASLPLRAQGTSLEAKALALVGGGGGVETGGGIGLTGMVGLRANVTERVALDLSGGWTTFPGGDLDGATAGIGLSWTNRPVTLAVDFPRSDLERRGVDGDLVDIEETRVAVLGKLYSPRGSLVKTDGEPYDEHLPLIGVGLERVASRHVTLLARAFVAYGGDVGGYKEGLLGVRYELDPIGRMGIRFGLQVEGGAAGGGGVDVGSGLIGLWSGRMATRLSRRSELCLEWGRVDASNGSFEAESAVLGIGFALSRPVLAGS